MKARKNRSFISFGPGTQFVSEDWLFDELSPFGMSKQGFRKWLRVCLDVPIIEVGNTRIINLFQFRLALADASRLGRPDMFTPGCEAVRRSKESITYRDPQLFATEWEDIVAELLAAREKMTSNRIDRTTQDMRLVASRMAEMCEQLLPSTVQRDYDREQNATRDTTNPISELISQEP
jgi:hypothetical protein